MCEEVLVNAVIDVWPVLLGAAIGIVGGFLTNQWAVKRRDAAHAREQERRAARLVVGDLLRKKSIVEGFPNSPADVTDPPTQFGPPGAPTTTTDLPILQAEMDLSPALESRVRSKLEEANSFAWRLEVLRQSVSTVQPSPPWRGFETDFYLARKFATDFLAGLDVLLIDLARVAEARDP